MMPAKTYSNSEVAALLARFGDPLRCWEAGRSIGSCILFSMGDRLPFDTRTRGTIEIGAASLTLEGNDWVIEQSGKEIADSETVSDADNERIASVFRGQELLALCFEPSSGECDIRFSGGLHINLAADVSIPTARRNKTRAAAHDLAQAKKG